MRLLLFLLLSYAAAFGQSKCDGVWRSAENRHYACIVVDGQVYYQAGIIPLPWKRIIVVTFLTPDFTAAAVSVEVVARGAARYVLKDAKPVTQISGYAYNMTQFFLRAPEDKFSGSHVESFSVSELKVSRVF